MGMFASYPRNGEAAQAAPAIDEEVDGTQQVRVQNDPAPDPEPQSASAPKTSRPKATRKSTS